jgi:hypothetical protein
MKRTAIKKKSFTSPSQNQNKIAGKKKGISKTKGS